MFKNRLKNIVKRVVGKKIIQKIHFWKIRKKNHELYNNIKTNIYFKNLHKGQRCFILGNGPSLRDVNFELLKDEIVFTVNCFSKVNNFEKVNPNYHLWIDYSFFELREDQKYNHHELMDDYEKMSKTNAKCFVPAIAYNFIKKYNLDKKLDIHYLLMGENNIKQSNIEYDLANFITTYSTVVQYAVTVAIYMGFTEIYLLGIDSTSILSFINTLLETKGKEEFHAYDKDDTKERNRQILNTWKMTDVFYDQYCIFHGYKVLDDFAKKNQIKIINCSSQTIVNELPRKRLCDVLQNK